MKSNCCRNSKPHFRHGDWKKEHAERLHLQFSRVEAARRQGKSVKAALQYFAWYWRGKSYRANPKIKVRLSPSHLRKLYYQWRRNGRTSSAVALRYKAVNRRPVKPAEIARFVRHASAPVAFTFAGAWNAMQRTQPLPYSMSHLWASLPAELRRELRRLFYGRRKQRGIETRFRRFLEKGGIV